MSIALQTLLAYVGALALLTLSPPAQAQILSPGPLAKAHGRFDDDSSCDRCHSGGRQVVQDKCLGCHKLVAAGMKRNGFHAKKARASGRTCSGCHPEHHGRGFPLIRWDPKKTGFKHKETGWDLKGAHGKLDCGKCHNRPRHRYQGLKTTCASCHPDPHRPSLGGDCRKCHTETAFKPASGFDHQRARFKLEGAHAKVKCGKCHEGEGHRRRFKGLRFGRCDDCHKDPHKGTMAPKACKDCHATTSSFKSILGAARSDHAGGRFPLRGKHANAACASCHAPQSDPKTTPNRCVSCHRSPHRKALAPRCSACHDERRWKGAESRSFPHARTGFPLRGAHGSLACARCHKSKGSFGKRFRGLKFDRCVRCHADRHHARYTSVPEPWRCEACHGETRFRPSTFGAERHGAAAFVLQGAHLAVPCATCHRRAPAEPRPSGEVSGPSASKPAVSKAGRRSPPAGVRPAEPPFQMHMAFRDCQACHKNPHGASFTLQMKEAGCAGCHVIAGWREARFDHAKTDFPLKGAHGKVPCTACHPGGSKAIGARFGKLSKECRSCHGDPHMGQFRATEPSKRCEECHSGEKTWKDLRFDHAEDSRFKLEGKHEKVKCESCHELRETAAGKAVVYRHGRLRCARCHEDHHGRGDWREGAR